MNTVAAIWCVVGIVFIWACILAAIFDSFKQWLRGRRR